jgi:ADP-ribose pyrophosphatase
MNRVSTEAPRPIVRVREVPVFVNGYGTLFDDEVRGREDHPGRYLRWEWSGRGVVAVPYRRGVVCVWPMYRYPIGAVSLEFPRGGMEPGETVEAAALRELTEETGLRGFAAAPLGFIHAESGLIANSLQVVAVEVNDGPEAAGHPESMESVAAAGRWLTHEDFLQHLGKGQVVCGITIASWALFSAAEALR